MTSDPLTHTVYYAGHRFQVAQKQAATIVNALMYAHTRGATGFFGIPASDAGNGNTVMRYLLIGPGIPVLVDGPKLEGIGTKQGTRPPDVGYSCNSRVHVVFGVVPQRHTYHGGGHAVVAMFSSRNACGTTTSEPVRNHKSAPRCPVGRRLAPTKWGTSSSVEPIRSTITKFSNAPYNSR